MAPGRNAPRAILRALVASFVLGGLILLFALMAVPNVSRPGEVNGLAQRVGRLVQIRPRRPHPWIHLAHPTGFRRGAHRNRGRTP